MAKSVIIMEHDDVNELRFFSDKVSELQDTMPNFEEIKLTYCESE